MKDFSKFEIIVDASQEPRVKVFVDGEQVKFFDYLKLEYTPDPEASEVPEAKIIMSKRAISPKHLNRNE